MAAAADQRHLDAKISIANIIAKVENDWWESARKLFKAMACPLKHFTLLFTES